MNATGLIANRMFDLRAFALLLGAFDQPAG